MLKNLSKILNKIYPIYDFLYILQLEEYENLRYFKRLKKFFWKRDLQKRGKLVLTKRIKIILSLALPLILILPPLTPVWIGLSNLILTPYFELIRFNIRRKASNYFAKVNIKTKVIVVAGSFGKTTTKNYIYELIKYSYKTQMIPGNINTPAGIADWILKKFDPSSDVLIVEVDTYFIGEISRSLKITPPDISILTNVGDQHLERLGNKLNLRKALHEVFDYAKPNAVKITNKKSNLDYALEVAKILQIPKDIINGTIKDLKAPERRRNLINLNGYSVIDDSYNISETTSKAGIEYAKAMAKKQRKKLIVITAGIPELGIENKNGNIHLGQTLSKFADRVFLLQSILANEVEFGINDKSIVTMVHSMKDVWDKLTKLNSKKYLVLIQPELNDLYY